MNTHKQLKTSAKVADEKQYANTRRLTTRANELHKWKYEVEMSIVAMVEEIKLLDQQRKRIIHARTVLKLVSSISSECMSCRAMRQGYDLRRDSAEEELIKESALIKEVEDLFDRSLINVQEQMVRNKAAKLKMESDWSDKQEAFEYEQININLKNQSPTILFKPAATRFGDKQSSPENWEKSTKELLIATEAVLAQSSELRALLDGPVLQECVRDLKAQAEKVDVALAKVISSTEECVKAMVDELELIARRNAECEKLKTELSNGIRGLDKAMKVSQTRLDILHQRPRMENCRDLSQYGLVDEVKTLSEQVSAMKDQLTEVEESLLNLIRSRTIIEKELQNKLKTVFIDKQRCQVIRSHYPTATAMSGFCA